MPVTHVMVETREPYEVAVAGVPWEKVAGELTFSIDPDNPCNAAIADLQLAPRNASGQVEFTSDFCLIAPTGQGSGVGRVLVDVVNRGRKTALDSFNRGAGSVADTLLQGADERESAGDSFLFKHGFAVLFIGWQHDVHQGRHKVDGGPLLGLDAPELEDQCGAQVSGQAFVEMRPNAAVNTWPLASRAHRPYAVHPAAAAAGEGTLLVKDWEDGPETEVPRTEWTFARQRYDNGGSNGTALFSGEPVPSREHIYLPNGFTPGKCYNFSYRAEAGVLVGAGLLALREAACWLKQPGVQNLLPVPVQHVYAYGSSQTGRLLRHFVHLGLNLDEAGNQAYDGILPHVAGSRRGEFNNRFAQPSHHQGVDVGHLPPFSVTGMLEAQRSRGGVPRMILTNSASEYWRGDGSLQHMSDDLRDLPDPPEARMYLFASTQHGAATQAATRPAELSGVPGDAGFIGQCAQTVIDYTPLLRAALINLRDWVEKGTKPPPSVVPRVRDATAVSRETVLHAMAALNLPGLQPDALPDPAKLWVTRPLTMNAATARGEAAGPLIEGGAPAFPCLVSAVDAAGNELGGLRLPELELPLATHLGWNPRHSATGAPDQLVPMQGSTIYFAPTAALRAECNDPRPSIAERYPTGHDDYMARARERAQALVASRYLLTTDIDMVLAHVEAQWAVAAGGELYPPCLAASPKL